MTTLARLLGRVTADQLAQRELEEARIALLNAQSAAEYFQAVVTYNQRRVARLEDWLNRGRPHA